MLIAGPAVEKGRGRGGPTRSCARDENKRRAEWADWAGSRVRLGFSPEAD
jgi:hypothetical protein